MLLFVHVACYVEWLNLLSYFFNAHFKMYVLRGIKNILYLSSKKAKEIVYVMNGRSYFLRSPNGKSHCLPDTP